MCLYTKYQQNYFTGGCKLTSFPLDCTESTEIIDTDRRVSITASPMNNKRFGHGMGVITINGKERLAVFGGRDKSNKWLDSAELYNTKTGKWEPTDIKLNGPKGNFGFLTMKLSEAISNF